MEVTELVAILERFCSQWLLLNFQIYRVAPLAEDIIRIHFWSQDCQLFSASFEQPLPSDH
jgi:hypothetical protein